MDYSLKGLSRKNIFNHWLIGRTLFRICNFELKTPNFRLWNRPRTSRMARDHKSELHFAKVVKNFWAPEGHKLEASPIELANGSILN